MNNNNNATVRFVCLVCGFVGLRGRRCLVCALVDEKIAAERARCVAAVDRWVGYAMNTPRKPGRNDVARLKDLRAAIERGNSPCKLYPDDLAARITLGE